MMNEDETLIGEVDLINPNQTRHHSVDYQTAYQKLMSLRSESNLKSPPELSSHMFAKIHALKQLQLKTIELDAKFHKKVLKMEEKFQLEHDEIFRQRCDIVNGNLVNNESWLEIRESLVDIREELKNVVMDKRSSEDDSEPPTMGVPKFWLIVLKRMPGGLVKEWDEPVLEHLYDVKYRTQTAPYLSFVLEFYFSINDFFENPVLEKEYFLKCAPDQLDPFSFDGPVICHSKGTEIQWKPGKDVTVQIERENDGNEFGVRVESFFNFFDPPGPMTEIDDAGTCETNATSTLEADFQIGHYLKDCVIPRAVLFFTGEVKGDVQSDDEKMGSLTMIYQNLESMEDLDDPDD